MTALVCRRVRVASISLLAGLLILAPAPRAHAQANSEVVPSVGGASASAPSGGETGKTAGGHHQAGHDQPKKKKSSFMHKMRDKAMVKVQKLFGPKPESKQVPKQQIE
jgi:hypothetical protein